MYYLSFVKQQTAAVVHLVPVGINVKETLLDVVPVSAKDVMDLLASVKRENASVTRHAVLQKHKEAA